MKDETRDASKYDITGEETTIQMCAIQLRLEAKILYLQSAYFLRYGLVKWLRVALLHCRKLVLNIQLLVVDFLLDCDEAYTKCSGHIVRLLQRK